MHFSEKDLQTQREELARLAGELASLKDKLNAEKKVFGVLRENVGLSSGEGPMPPELKAAMDALRQKAEKEARQAAATLREICQPKSARAGIHAGRALLVRGIRI